MALIDINEAPYVLDEVVRVGNVYRAGYVLQRDPDGTPVALSIVNATFTGGIATDYNQTPTLALAEVDDYTTDSGIVIGTAASGEFTVWVKGADTTILQAVSDEMVYWILATWASDDSIMPNVVKMLLAGKFLIPN